jgi:putative flippase GtrA
VHGLSVSLARSLVRPFAPRPVGSVVPMTSLLGRLLDHARSADGRKQLRYVGVSVVFVPIGQILIQVLAPLVGSYTNASVVAAAVLTPFNFLANKYLVWRLSATNNLRTQIIVFWVGAMLAVSLATGFTYLVERLTGDQPALVQRIAVLMAQLAGFGIVWVGRYLVLDRWLFKATHHGEEPDAAEVDELHHDFPI